MPLERAEWRWPAPATCGRRLSLVVACCPQAGARRAPLSVFYSVYESRLFRRATFCSRVHALAVEEAVLASRPHHREGAGLPGAGCLIAQHAN